MVVALTRNLSHLPFLLLSSLCIFPRTAEAERVKQAEAEVKQAEADAKQAEAVAKAEMESAAPDQRDLLQARFEKASAYVFFAEARHAVAKAEHDEARAKLKEAAADRALTIAQLNKDEGATRTAQKSKEGAAVALKKAERDLKDARAVEEVRNNKVLACSRVVAAVMALGQRTRGSEEHAKAEEELQNAKKHVLTASDHIKPLLGRS